MSWYRDEPRPEYWWEREARERKERAERAAAFEAEVRQNVLTALQHAYRKGSPVVNLRSREHRALLPLPNDATFATVKWDSPFGIAIFSSLCWLRGEGAVGVAGFSGTNPKDLSRFFERTPRCDIHLFPSIAEIAA